MWIESSWKRYLDSKACSFEGNLISILMKMYSLLNKQEIRSQWMISLTSQSKKLLTWLRIVLMKRVNIDHLLFQLSLVYSQPTFTCIVPRCTIGAHAVTLRTHPSVMVNASGSWHAADQFLSTFLNQATTSFATAKCQQMRHSATVLIKLWSDGFTNTIEVSGDCGVLVPSGLVSHTGCSPSTSEWALQILSCTLCINAL